MSRERRVRSKERERMGRFLQAAGDFPVMVTLGDRVPVWELQRWGRDRLRVCPVERDRYVLRGDSRRILYKGERESHRFTILDTSRFEYDIILKKEPESNKRYLLLEGWEGFDFFRQPEGFGPELLRGSYAVYKKEFVLNSTKYHVGTGKFCHIHRPKAIDRRGRETWGDIWIDRGIMTISIPEGWLGEAAYPVLIDPVIGSNAIGAYSTFPYMNQGDYEWYLQALAANPNGTDIYYYYEDRRLILEDQMALNRQTAPLTLQGTYNAYLYGDYTDGSETFAYPMMYGSLNDKPKQILLSDTTDTKILVNSSKPAKWNKGTVTFATPVSANTDIWFGFVGEAGPGCRFDYGSPYRGVYGFYPYEGWYLDGYESVLELIEDSGYADIGGKPDYLCDSGSDTYNWYPGARFDFKISMYLELPAQNYKRTLTQGVKLTDSRKRTGAYKRNMAQTVKGTTVLKRTGSFLRTCVMNAGNGMILKLAEGFYRNCVMGVRSTTALARAVQIIRNPVELLGALMGLSHKAGINRTLSDQAAAGSVMTRKEDHRRSIGNTSTAGDYSACSVVWLRRLPEQETVTDQKRHIGAYIRGLYTAAGNLAEPGRTAEYSRKQEDTAFTGAVSLRHLFVFIRLLTGTYIRDYIIGRFLKSREEIVIKSPVCRELMIDSRLH
jgi:hypothetical protein